MTLREEWSDAATEYDRRLTARRETERLAAQATEERKAEATHLAAQALAAMFDQLDEQNDDAHDTQEN